jgi:hypothetical protein
VKEDLGNGERLIEGSLWMNRTESLTDLGACFSAEATANGRLSKKNAMTTLESD